MRPTRVIVLVGLAIAAVPAGWTLARLFDVFTGVLPSIPWATPVLLAVFAAGLLLAARMVRLWIHERRYDRQLGALRIARLVVLAKAATVLGALVAGGYAGFGVQALRFAESDYGRQRILVTALTVVAGILVAVAALRLERAAYVPPPEDEDRHPPEVDAD